jgi:hypothetical protein
MNDAPEKPGFVLLLKFISWILQNKKKKPPTKIPFGKSVDGFGVSDHRNKGEI